MHELHAVLLDVSDYNLENRNELELVSLTNNIRNDAVIEIREFTGIVFDYFVEEDAGRWKGEYGKTNDVLLGINNNNFYDILKKFAVDKPKKEIKHFHKKLDDIDLNDIDELEKLYKNETEIDDFNLLMLSRLIYRKYNFYLPFYNSISLSSELYENTKKYIKENPEDYALVFFDVHS